MAFATMHVSNWRRASSSDSVNKGATCMEIPLPDSICHHRCQFVKTGFSNAARMDAVASTRRPLSLVAYRFRKLARRALLPTAGNVTSGDSTQYANQYIRLAVKLLMRRIQRMEAGDCRGFLQTGR